MMIPAPPSLAGFLELLFGLRDIASLLEAFENSELQEFTASIGGSQAARGRERLLQASHHEVEADRRANVRHAAERFSDAAIYYVESHRRTRSSEARLECALHAVANYALAAHCNWLAGDELVARARLLDLCRVFFTIHLGEVEKSVRGEWEVGASSRYDIRPIRVETYSIAAREVEKRRAAIAQLEASEQALTSLAEVMGHPPWAPVCKFRDEMRVYGVIQGEQEEIRRSITLRREEARAPRWMQIDDIGIRQVDPPGRYYLTLSATAALVGTRLWARRPFDNLLLVALETLGLLVSGLVCGTIVEAGLSAVGFPWLPPRIGRRWAWLAKLVAILVGLYLGWLVGTHIRS